MSGIKFVSRYKIMASFRVWLDTLIPLLAKPMTLADILWGKCALLGKEPKAPIGGIPEGTGPQDLKLPSGISGLKFLNIHLDGQSLQFSLSYLCPHSFLTLCPVRLGGRHVPSGEMKLLRMTWPGRLPRASHRLRAHPPVVTTASSPPQRSPAVSQVARPLHQHTLGSEPSYLTKPPL